MAYDEAIAQRLRDHLEGEPGISEKKMFGGVGFMIHGNMAVAASSTGGLLLRVDPDQSEDLLADPAAEPMVMRGREMTGWLAIDGARLSTEEELRRWVDLGVRFARSLPPK